jgi:protein-disulfide isomerase
MSQPARTKTQSGATRRQTRKEAARKRDQQQRLIRIAIGTAIAAVLVVVVLILLNRTEDAPAVDYSGIAFSPPPAVTAALAGATASPAAEASGHVTGAALGDPNAPVTMVVYADYQCPFCGQFALDMQPKIVQDFVREGKVRLEFMEFPVLGGADLTDKGNESAQSAEAVLCAAEQDAYLPYHDTLYANQSGENKGAFNHDRLLNFAGDLGLDEDAFGTCLDSGKYEPTIAQMKAQGQALGITGTPMFVINGQVVSLTGQGYDLLEKQIETAVQQAEQ